MSHQVPKSFSKQKALLYMLVQTLSSWPWKKIITTHLQTLWVKVDPISVSAKDAHFFFSKFWTCSYCHLSCLNYSPILSSTGPFPCYVCCLLYLLLFAIFYYWKNTCVSQLGGIFGLSVQLYYFLLCISSPSVVICLCFLNNMLLQHMYEQNKHKKLIKNQ